MLSQITPFNKYRKERLLLTSVQQIRSQLPQLLSSDRSFNMFYYNGQNIIRLLNFVLNQTQYGGFDFTELFYPKEVEELFQIELLLSKYGLKEIVYAILTSLFRFQQIQTSEHEEIDLRIGSNIFIQQKPLSLAILFESILQNVCSGRLESFQSYFKRINQQVQACIAQIKKNDQLLLLQCLELPESLSYSRYLTVNLNHKDSIGQINKPITIDFSSFAHFCIGLETEWSKMFGQSIKQQEINNILTILGLAINLESKKKYTKNMIASYLSLCFRLQLKQHHQNHKIAVILITFQLPKQNKPVSFSEFVDNQKQMVKQLQTCNFINCCYLCLANNTYLIDPTPIYDKGLKVRNARVYQIEGSAFIDDLHRQYYFSHRQCLIKIVSQNPFKSHPRQQVKIVNLIKQIQHKQQLLKLGKFMGFEEKSALLGLNRVVKVIQTINYQSKQLKQSYLIFESCQTELETYVESLLEEPDQMKKSQEIYKISTQIADGINCLHLQLAKYYDFELNYHSATKEESTLVGIYHCEIKSTNIMITKTAKDLQVRLIDFSASIFAREDVSLNQIQKKEHYYRPPEAWKGKNIDQNIDLWSLGVLLFQLWIAGAPLPPSVKQIQDFLQKQENVPLKWKQTIKKLLSSNMINSTELLSWFQRNKFYLLMENHQNLVKQFITASKFEILQDKKVRSLEQFELKAQNIQLANRYNLQELMLSLLLPDNDKMSILACVFHYLKLNLVPTLYHTIQIAKIRYIPVIKQSKKWKNIVMIYQKRMDQNNQILQFPLEVVNIQRPQQQSIAIFLRDRTVLYHRWFDSSAYYHGYCFQYDSTDKTLLSISPILLKSQLQREQRIFHKIDSTITLLYRQPPSSGLITLQLFINGTVFDDFLTFLKQIVEIASKNCFKIQYDKSLNKQEKKESFQPFGKIQLKNGILQLKLSQQFEKFLSMYVAKIKQRQIFNNLLTSSNQLLKLAYEDNWSCNYEIISKISRNVVKIILKKDAYFFNTSFDVIRKIDPYNQTILDFERDPKSIGMQLKVLISLFYILNHMNYPPLLARIFTQLTFLAQNLLSLICQRMRKVFQLNMAYMISWQIQTRRDDNGAWNKLLNLMNKCKDIAKRSDLSESQRLKWRDVFNTYKQFHEKYCFVQQLLNLF